MFMSGIEVGDVERVWWGVKWVGVKEGDVRIGEGFGMSFEWEWEEVVEVVVVDEEYEVREGVVGDWGRNDE